MSRLSYDYTAWLYHATAWILLRVPDPPHKILIESGEGCYVVAIQNTFMLSSVARVHIGNDSEPESQSLLAIGNASEPESQSLLAIGNDSELESQSLLAIGKRMYMVHEYKNEKEENAKEIEKHF